MDDYRSMYKANSFRDQRFGLKDHRTEMEREDNYITNKKITSLKRKKLSLFNLDSEDEQTLEFTHKG